jgi:hypothetical protein
MRYPKAEEERAHNLLAQCEKYVIDSINSTLTVHPIIFSSLLVLEGYAVHERITNSSSC